MCVGCVCEVFPHLGGCVCVCVFIQTVNACVCMDRGLQSESGEEEGFSTAWGLGKASTGITARLKCFLCSCRKPEKYSLLPPGWPAGTQGSQGS